MSYTFSQVPEAEVRRSKFNRSHGFKAAFNSGYLIPFFCDDVLPGDTFDLSTSMVARLTTPIVPVMDAIHIDTFFFFVPNRLVWDNFQRFMGEQKNPGDSIDFTEPQIQFDTAAEFGSIFDYIGVPPGISLSQPDWPSALPFRACNLIWNEWFRDQNLQDSLTVSTGDGPDPMSDYTLFKRGKRHDYFTSSLPFAQKGPGVNIPLSGTAPVVGTGKVLGITNGDLDLVLAANVGDGYRIYGAQNYTGTSVTSAEATTHASTGRYGVSTDPAKSGLQVNLGDAQETVTINTMRQAFAMQRLMETLARSGSRYTELLRGVFGVISPDARLQRPEFLGGTTDFINVSQVPQTSATDGTSPQGHMAAFGYMSSSDKHGFTKSFTEHGWIIGFVNVWSDLTYQQGMNRNLSRRTRWDYYWPQLANIGEQTVLNKEIFLSSDSDQNNEAFGYQERYAEYRYHPSRIAGVMRSTAPTSLDVWHLSQHFESLPKLNSTFIEENPPLDRVLAVQDEPQIYLDTWFNLSCVRPMPLFGIPGFGNRF